MLILTRRVGETIKIGDDITVPVLGVKGLQVRIGINDEVDRRGYAPTINEAALSRSSTLSLAYRSCGPRSVQPIVRRARG
jgi:hypothetical protein